MAIEQFGYISTLEGNLSLTMVINSSPSQPLSYEDFMANMPQVGDNLASKLNATTNGNPQKLFTLPGNFEVWSYWYNDYVIDGISGKNIELRCYNNNTLMGVLGIWGNIRNDGLTTFATLRVYYDDTHPNKYSLAFAQYLWKTSGTYMYLFSSISQNDASREFTYNLLNGLVHPPIVYSYEPINFITGNNKSLKLSMIKAANTNHGESVTDGTTTDIQRFTDATNMRVFCADMAENAEKVLGYTAANNYVTVTKGYVDGSGAYTVTFKYYINGVYQSALDHTARVTSNTIPSEPVWTPYYSLLLDTEHNACRPSRIYLNEQTNTVRYNDSENDQNVISDINQTVWFNWLADGYRTETGGPYDYGGTSEPDSGDGQWDNTSENIDIPSIPSVSISDTGFVSVFNPTLSQVKALADYMWAGAFDVSLFKKVMANPMDSIIGFALIPCEPSISGVDTVKVGNIDTGVSMNAVSNQFVDVNCGTLDLEQYWGNYLDYAPYTKISLVLPFIGTVHLSPDDCMKKKIGIKYRIDILSGGCVAYVTCNGSVLYQFTGSCSAQLPITNLDYRGMISALISIGTTAVGVGSAIASGGITAPMAAVGIGSTANNVMNGKPNIQHGGSLGSTSGFLGTRTPYLIITRPRQCVPEGVEAFTGYPSFITDKLKNVTGFTKIDAIHLDDVAITQAEKSELLSLLKEGVII